MIPYTNVHSSKIIGKSAYTIDRTNLLIIVSLIFDKYTFSSSFTPTPKKMVMYNAAENKTVIIILKYVSLPK